MDVQAADIDRHDRAFLGRPRALGDLAFAEAWERLFLGGLLKPSDDPAAAAA